MKFLVPNYSCLQNPWLGGHCPQIPVLCPQLNLLNPPPNKIPGYATAATDHDLEQFPSSALCVVTTIYKMQVWKREYEIEMCNIHLHYNFITMPSY
jgi:hypothetical protein